MRKAIFIAIMLAAVAAWDIDGSTPQVEGVSLSVDCHTAGTVSTKDVKQKLLLPAENFTVRLRSPSLSGSTGSPPRAGSRGKVEGKGGEVQETF